MIRICKHAEGYPAADHVRRRSSPALRGLQPARDISFESELTTLEGYSCSRATYIPQFGDDVSTVLGFHRDHRDVTGQKLEKRRLIELSQLDSLTGALNRAGFDQRLDEAIARSRSTGSLMALMYLDVDRFKKVNDSHGHLIGDALLKGFTGRISRALRATDIVARLGGDEFTIIVEGLSHRDDAARIATNLVNAVRLPFILEAQILQIATSIGVAVDQGDEDMSATTLIRQADELLYSAKGEGRNRFRIALVGDAEDREREQRYSRHADSDVD